MIKRSRRHLKSIISIAISFLLIFGLLQINTLTVKADEIPNEEPIIEDNEPIDSESEDENEDTDVLTAGESGIMNNGAEGD